MKFAKQKKLNKLDRGASLIEFALLIALISVITLASINHLATKLACTFATAERMFFPYRSPPTAIDISPTDYRSCT